MDVLAALRLGEPQQALRFCSAQIGRLLLLKIAIARDPNAMNYMDRALTPVRDDDDETFDLLTKTTSPRVAIAHGKKVAELTGAH